MGGQVRLGFFLETVPDAERDQGAAQAKADADHHREDIRPDLLAGYRRQTRAAIGGQTAECDEKRTRDAIGKLHDV